MNNQHSAIMNDNACSKPIFVESLMPLMCDELTSVPDWIIEHPETAAVFSELGLDTSCGGKSLEFLCRQQDIDTATVLARLRCVVKASQRNLNQ